MLLNVLVRDADDGHGTPLLVTPFRTQETLPHHLREFRWRGLATADTEDRLLRAQRIRIEAEISCHGYCCFFPG